MIITCWKTATGLLRTWFPVSPRKFALLVWRSTFRVPISGGLTGAEVARQILDGAGLQDVTIEATPGMLSDHYDPRTKRLRLSQNVYYAPTVAAAGVAAHEAGHAIQDKEDYFPLEARSYIVPLVQLSSQAAPWLFIGGIMLNSIYLTWVGVILFGASSLFSLVTLPVEFNASKRALNQLVNLGIIRNEDQVQGVKKVLSAAAWTYVAAAMSAIGSWLFYIVLMLGSRDRRAGR